MERTSTVGASVALLLCSTVGLTGCTPPVAGKVGLTVDSSGRPIAILEICEGHIDGLSLFDTATDRSAEVDQPSLGEWSADQPITASSRLDLTQPSPGWRVLTPLTALRPGVAYRIYGWTRDGSWSASGVEFAAEDLKRLRAGQVRYDAGLHADEEDPPDTTATIPAEQFRTRACL